MTARKAFVFDAYGTLFDVYAVAKSAEAMFPGMGSRIAVIWRDKQIEYARLVSLSDPSSGGSRYYQPFWDLTRHALSYSLQMLRLEHSIDQVDTLMAAYEKLDPYPECAAVLQTLQSKGLVTAVLSNGSPQMLKMAAQSAGLSDWLDHLISIEPAKHFKTSPVCYALAPDVLKLPTSSLVFVSSNAWDVVGAKWYGFYTCWINRQQLPYETIGVPPDRSFASLEGLLDLL